MLERTVPRIKIVPVTDIRTSRSWAIYGKSGTGKTTFASTFPKPLLLLDVRDEGTESVRDVRGIEVVRISEWGQFEQVYDLLRGKHKYKSVVIDTMTQAQLLMVNSILRQMHRPQVEQAAWGTLTLQQWGAVGANLKELIATWRNLPLEVCFVAQERVFNVEESGDDVSEQLAPEVGPSLSPATAAHLNACVSVIANLFIRVRRRHDEKRKREVVSMTRCMRLGPNPVYVTKVRKPQKIELPLEVDNPTWQIVTEIIEGEE